MVSTPTGKPNIGSDILGYAWIVAWRSLLHVNTIDSWANSTVLFAFWILFASLSYNLCTVVFVEGKFTKTWTSKVVEVKTKEPKVKVVEVKKQELKEEEVNQSEVKEEAE